MNDMEKASQIGIPAYNAEQEEKRKLLDFLLSHYNDGRRKNLFCVAVNLLTIKEIENSFFQSNSIRYSLRNLLNMP